MMIPRQRRPGPPAAATWRNYQQEKLPDLVSETARKCALPIIALVNTAISTSGLSMKNPMQMLSAARSPESACGCDNYQPSGRRRLGLAAYRLRRSPPRHWDRMIAICAQRVDAFRRNLDLLRERLDLIGTKKGLRRGQCGACRAGGWQADQFLPRSRTRCDGRDVLAIEGVAPGERRWRAAPRCRPAFIAHDELPVRLSCARPDHEQRSACCGKVRAGERIPSV